MPTFERFPQDIAGVVEMGRRLGNDRPLRRILTLLRRMGCQTYAVTEPYQDPDIAAEYDLYYKYSSVGAKAEGVKLDFFADTVTRATQLSACANSAYLGQVVLRPTPRQRVCKAVIRDPFDESVTPLGTHYVLSKAACECHVGDRILQLPASPFIQQDSHAGVCAHAALMMISATMAHLRPELNLIPFTLKEIGEAIRSVTPYFIPLMGLSPIHVAKAFEAMGLAGDAIYVFPPDSEFPTAEQIVYTYAESKLPVFLGLPLPERPAGHCVVVIGHTFEPHAWWPEAFPAYYRRIQSGEGWLSSVAWAGDFLIHDDNFGPYMAMPKHITSVSWVAVPLPKYVLLKGEIAELFAFWALRTAWVTEMTNSLIVKKANRWAEVFKEHLAAGRIVLRTLLMTREEFVESARQTGDLKEDIREQYTEADLPPHVWLVEVTVPEILGSGYRLGEVVLDAGYPPNFVRAGHEPILFIHIPGVFARHHPGLEDLERFTVADDQASRILDRHSAP